MHPEGIPAKRNGGVWSGVTCPRAPLLFVLLHFSGARLVVEVAVAHVARMSSREREGRRKAWPPAFSLLPLVRYEYEPHYVETP